MTRPIEVFVSEILRYQRKISWCWWVHKYCELHFSSYLTYNFISITPHFLHQISVIFHKFNFFIWPRTGNGIIFFVYRSSRWCCTKSSDEQTRGFYIDIQVWVLIEQKDGKSTWILGENSGSNTYQFHYFCRLTGK